MHTYTHLSPLEHSNLNRHFLKNVTQLNNMLKLSLANHNKELVGFNFWLTLFALTSLTIFSHTKKINSPK